MGLITFSGASAVGKSSVAQLLLKSSDVYQLLLSTTTRPPRATDLPGEYEYLSSEEFQQRQDFLWQTEVHGNHYGTSKKLLDEAINSSKQSILILIPQVLGTLRKYLKEQGVPNRSRYLRSYYILSPLGPILRERLQQRGDSPEVIEKRLQDCRDWDSQARESPFPYVYVTNNGTLLETLDEIQSWESGILSAIARSYSNE